MSDTPKPNWRPLPFTSTSYESVLVTNGNTCWVDQAGRLRPSFSNATHWMTLLDAAYFLKNFPPPKEPKFKRGDIVKHNSSCRSVSVVGVTKEGVWFPIDALPGTWGLPYDNYDKIGEATLFEDTK